MEYLSPQGVLLPLVYGTTASPLWLELRGHSAWQVTPSWTVYRLACHRLLPWLRVTFPMVPDAAWPGSDQWLWSTAPATGPVGQLGRPSASDPLGIGSFLSLGRPTCVQRPGPLAPVHRCARAVCCGASAVSWASWLLFTGVLARCVVLHVRCPGPLGSCSPVCVLCAVRVCPGWLCPSSSPPNFRFFFYLFFVFVFVFFFLPVFFFGGEKRKRKNKKEENRGARTLQAQAWAAGAAVL